MRLLGKALLAAGHVVRYHRQRPTSASVPPVTYPAPRVTLHSQRHMAIWPSRMVFSSTPRPNWQRSRAAYTWHHRSARRVCWPGKGEAGGPREHRSVAEWVRRCASAEIQRRRSPSAEASLTVVKTRRPLPSTARPAVIGLQPVALCVAKLPTTTAWVG